MTGNSYWQPYVNYQNCQANKYPVPFHSTKPKVSKSMSKVSVPLPSEAIAEEAPSKPRSVALVRPGDISDALDSRDLLERLVSENTERIIKKVDTRIVEAWLLSRKQDLRNDYINRARGAYEKMWRICSDKKVGHHFIIIDVRGYTINQCDDCKYCTPTAIYNPGSGDQFRYNNEKRNADSMNNDLIKALADRMIEVDIEAGLFSWPTEHDYPNIQEPTTKKRRLFG